MYLVLYSAENMGFPKIKEKLSFRGYPIRTDEIFLFNKFQVYHFKPNSVNPLCFLCFINYKHNCIKIILQIYYEVILQRIELWTYPYQEYALPD
jgi:hypothetical protein